MKQDEYSTAGTTLKRWSKRNTTADPQWPTTKDKASSPNQLISLYVGAFIMSEDRPAGIQLKKTAKVLPLIGLTTKHAVCGITFMYPVL